MKTGDVFREAAILTLALLCSYGAIQLGLQLLQRYSEARGGPIQS